MNTRLKLPASFGSSLLIISFFCALGFLPIEVANAGKSTANLIELTGVNPKNLSEKDLYVQVIEKYRESDAIGLKARTKLLTEKYPKSVFNDNALYLNGRLGFEQKRYAESVGFYNELLKKYPNSNKAVSARYSKGLAYYRMNLAKQATSVMQEVVRKNPGSYEAARAQTELKLLARGNPPTVKSIGKKKTQQTR
ncbi:MAG: tol-pal system YbgF family protein [Pseudobdellovibrionaceae bacterium]